jgi:hypothetical protein
MYYGSTNLATDWKTKDTEGWGVRLLRVLFIFIPRANKDNEKFYPLVKQWWLEVDDQGVPVREIGVDENGEPLFSAPNERNYGLWTDSNNTFSPEEMDVFEKEKFIAAWDKLSCA